MSSASLNRPWAASSVLRRRVLPSSNPVPPPCPRCGPPCTVCSVEPPITAAATRFWDNQQGGTRIAVVAATGAVIAATVIALGIIVSSDVRGRATGAAAIYHTRARVARTFLDASMAAKQTPALSVFTQLEKLKELRSAKVLTESEFAEQKAKLFSS